MGGGIKPRIASTKDQPVLNSGTGRFEAEQLESIIWLRHCGIKTTQDTKSIKGKESPMDE